MIKIKIHNVLHEEVDETPTDVEENIVEWIESNDRSINVENVRIEWGDKNSPIFVTLSNTGLSLETIRSVARQALLGFRHRGIEGVDIEKCLREDNLMIRSS